MWLKGNIENLKDWSFTISKITGYCFQPLKLLTRKYIVESKIIIDRF